MRPLTLIYFERIIFGSLLLGVLSIYLNWNRIIAQAVTPYHDSSTSLRLIQNAILITIIFTFALFGTLALLVSRRRSKIAMWVLVTWGLLSVSVTVVNIVRGQLLGSNVLTALQCFGDLVAFSLLFTRSARLWMSRKDEKHKLHEVFD
jgi:uncharacterized membrane protein